MKVALIKVKCQSGSPDVDDSSIQFVFESDTATGWALSGALLRHAEHFLTVPGTGATHAVGSYISPAMDRTPQVGSIEVYDITAHLNGTPHGSPVAMSNFTLPAPLTHPGGFPEGVAATVSFRADYGTDVEFGPHTRPRARDRNRVYVGPLGIDAFVVADFGQHCRLDPTFMAVCLDAMLDLSTTVNDAGNDWNLRVWSRVNAAVKIPTTAWMDDRPDYQRRRSDPTPGTKAFKALAAT